MDVLKCHIVSYIFLQLLCQLETKNIENNLSFTKWLKFFPSWVKSLKMDIDFIKCYFCTWVFKGYSLNFLQR